MVFMDSKRARDASHIGGETILRRSLGEMPLLAPFAQEPLYKIPRILDASCRIFRTCWDDGIVRIGEAAGCLHPLSSQGVHSALRSGLQAAIALNTLLKWPARSDMARAFYEERMRESVTNSAKVAALLSTDCCYHATSDFWRDRSTPLDENPRPEPDQRYWDIQWSSESLLMVCPMTRISHVTCISDDSIELKLGISHPNLPRPVVFFGNQAVAPLIERFQSGIRLKDILQTGSDLWPKARVLEFITFLGNAGVLYAEKGTSHGIQAFQ
jgi:hypothetical protein